MPDITTSDFAGIENVSAGASLPHIALGDYVFEVVANKKRKGRKGQDWYINEFKVIKSQGAEANPVGSLCSLVMDKSWDSTLPRIKGLVAAIVNEPERAVTASMADEVFSDAQPCRGHLVRATAYKHEKQDGTYSANPRVVFTPYVEGAASTAAST